MAFESARRFLWPVLRIILVAIILAGVWLRFEGLGRRPVWYDEVATFLHLSGKTEAQLGRLYDGRTLRVGELLEEYQSGVRAAGAGASQASLGSSAEDPTMACVLRLTPSRASQMTSTDGPALNTGWKARTCPRHGAQSRQTRVACGPPENPTCQTARTSFAREPSEMTAAHRVPFRL